MSLILKKVCHSKATAHQSFMEIVNLTIVSSFSELRLICRRSDSCSKRLSGFNNSFLKPLAQQFPSFFQDATNFLNIFAFSFDFA